MERNIIIENICTACRCGERRAEEYLAAELRKSNCLFYKHLIFMYFCPIINF